MGRQGTLHPRKHPCSSAGVVPAGTHTQTDRFRHTQTDSDTHRNPHAQRVLPFPKGTHLLPLFSPASEAQSETEAGPTYSLIAVEGVDLGGHGLVPSHSSISEEEGYHEEPKVFHLRDQSEGQKPFTNC